MQLCHTKKVKAGERSASLFQLVYDNYLAIVIFHCNTNTIQTVVDFGRMNEFVRPFDSGNSKNRDVYIPSVARTARWERVENIWPARPCHESCKAEESIM